MRILILLKTWPGGVGGGVKNVIKELEKLGHQVNVIAREEDLKIYSFLKSIFIIRKIIKDKGKNYDIIYTHDWSLAFPLFFPLPIYRKKHFCMFHGNQFGFGRILQNITGRMMEKRLLVIGDSLKKRFKKSNLVYAGVNLTQFKPLGKKRKNLGWIDKGTEILEKKDIDKLAKRLKLKPLITRNFSIPFDKMNTNFYNKCKIFISLPPKTAGFNVCWIEAMAAGVPIIIGNEEGIGCKLPFTKVKDKKDLFNLTNVKETDYYKWLIKSELIWKKHSKRLIEIFSKR